MKCVVFCTLFFRSVDFIDLNAKNEFSPDGENSNSSFVELTSPNPSLLRRGISFTFLLNKEGSFLSPLLNKEGLGEVPVTSSD
jgi:hypothetical protein